MPIIVFASSKGGVGKTTSAMTLACVIAREGVPLTVIDSDPNRPIATWAEQFPDFVPKTMTVMAPAPRDMARVLRESAERDPFVIVDLEGTKSAEVSVGLGRADLALIPMQASQLDAMQAAHLVELVKHQEEVFTRKIPYRVFLTRTSPVIQSKSHKALLDELTTFEIPIMQASLMEREAYRLPFRIGATIYELEKGDVRNPASAIENAEEWAKEVIAVLDETQSQKETV
jgi:chromosome partitioning protein